MKVLFSGATGVLGRASVPRMVAAGHDVTALARNPHDSRWLDEIGARPWTGDLFDPESVGNAMSGIDTVVHYATSIPTQRSMTRRSAWRANDRIRAHATGILVDAAIAHGVGRFVQESITFFYADGGETWLNESARIAPSWGVLESALEAEKHVDRFRGGGGIGVILRMSRLYGPGRASADYIDSLMRRKLPIVGNGRNYVSSLHTEDAATATLSALDAPDGFYNVSDDEPLRSAEHMRSLASILNAPQPRQIPSWPARLVAGDAVALLTTSQRISNAAFKDATGWRPKFATSSEGWRDIVASGGRR